MQLRSISLHAPDLDALQTFYVDGLGLPLVSRDAGALVLQCGDTALRFLSGNAGIYHFAFNICPSLVRAALGWLEGKGIAVLPFEGEAVVDFPAWEAEAVYFHDPAGNVVELIGRRRLPVTGDGVFSAADIRNVSELGIASLDLGGLVGRLQEVVGLPVFGKPSEVFCAMGNDEGLLILVDSERKRWIPNMEMALPLPFEAVMVEGGREWKLSGEVSGVVVRPA